MNFLISIIFLMFTVACSHRTADSSDYEGISAWSKYQELSSKNKRAVKSAYPPNSIKRFKIPEQKISYVGEGDAGNTILREAPKVVRFSLNQQRSTTEIPEVAKMNMEKVYFQEQYTSAAGSVCMRKRAEKAGHYSAQIICRYPDGREYHVNDLTQ